MSWYVRRGEREIGPLGDEALRALVGTGQIIHDTQLWREGLSRWTAAGLIPDVLGPRAIVSLGPGGQTAITATSDSTRAATDSPGAGAAALALATPWRRFWARSLDLAVSSMLVGLLLGVIRPSLAMYVGTPTGLEGIILLSVLPVALTMDALICWAMGNTPGKAIAAIKVLREGGSRPLGARAYLGRNFGVYVFGLGLGLPLISLLTLFLGYRRAAAAEVSIWDRFSGSRAYVLSAAQLRTWVTACVYVIGVTSLLGLSLSAQRNGPRHTAARTPAVILQQELRQAANRVNASTPRMIDEMTRLDGAYAGPGPLFTYNYTITSIRARSLSPTTLQTLRWRLSANVRQAACAGNGLKPMLRAGARVRFYYRDEDGQELALVLISGADCGS